MGESYFWKPFAQGVATPIVLIGGTNLLLKDFKVSNPYLYWGGLAASSAIVLGILADKIKVPILNAESIMEGKYKGSTLVGKEGIQLPDSDLMIAYEESPNYFRFYDETGGKVGEMFEDDELRTLFVEYGLIEEEYDAESDNCPICKGDIYGDMSMIGEEIVPDICGDCDIYVMPQGSDFKVRCMECGYGDIYGSRTPCEECESIADKMEAVNNRMNAESRGEPTGIGWAKSYVKSVKENPASPFKLQRYIWMGDGKEKRIGGVPHIIFSDNSALKLKETWIDGELDDVEWVLASTTRIDMKSGKGVYEAETFEANPNYYRRSQVGIPSPMSKGYVEIKAHDDEKIRDWLKTNYMTFNELIENHYTYEGLMAWLDEYHEEVHEEWLNSNRMDAETFNSDSHTDSFMADMPVNAVKNNDGWYIPSVHRNDYKEIFKNWSPKAYPYEKRITQDSVNEGCNSCGKENVHYQFYLARTNSVNPKMRFVDGATHCHYDTNTCGGNICGDCADNASCENCGGEICSYCEQENNYDHSDLVCVDCREFNESLEDD